MAEYIKREDIHLALDRHYFPGELSLKETIDSVPAADVVERKKGEWMVTKFSFKLEHQSERNTYYTCSVCNASYECENADYDFNFCPNCGADMRGGDAE